ncbi:MAG: HNH endonuclease signature motif containing protein, partial [Pseudonocardiaceae bacterium]
MHRIAARAPRLTTGQLIEQIKKWAIAVDPDWARRRYEQAVANRKVVGYRNADGSANLSGYNLPVDRVAAAGGHIDALAKAAKRAGDCRVLDHIRADLFLGMTDGTYAGLNDAEIIELLTTGPVLDADRSNSGDGDGDDAADDGDGEPDVKGLDDGGTDDSGPGAAGEARDGGGDEPVGDEPADVRPAGNGPQGSGADGEEAGECRSPASLAPPIRRAPLTVGTGLELRVRLSTLLGRDQYPAELAGWGPLHAELARDLAVTLGGAQWRFAVTDKDGQLISCGVTRARPVTIPTRSVACRAIVELQVPATALRALVLDPTTPADWANVVTDLFCQPDHDTAGHSGYCADADRRAPGAALRRYLEIRDRYCIMIGCRAPAHGTDIDHTLDHAKTGATADHNLGNACRHDHRLKHEGGWQLHQPNQVISAGPAPSGRPTAPAANHSSPTCPNLYPATTTLAR